MKTLTFALALFCAAPLSASTIPLSSVTSDYTFVDASTPNACYAPGTIAIASSVSPCHDLWVTPDGGGDWFLMNGDTDRPGQVAYRATLDVDQDSTYELTSVLANICALAVCGDPLTWPLYAWYLDGVRWLDVQTDGPGHPDTFVGRFDTGSRSSVTLELRNDSTIFTGNDGALRTDVDLSKTPEPASLFLLGTGLLGVGSAARRRVRR